jgi:hypothetical protein
MIVDRPRPSASSAEAMARFPVETVYIPTIPGRLPIASRISSPALSPSVPRFDDLNQATLGMPLGQVRAEAALAFAQRQHRLHVCHDDDVSAARTDQSSHQVAGDAPGRGVVEPDVGEAARIRQVGNHRKNWPSSRELMQRIAEFRMLGRDNDESVRVFRHPLNVLDRFPWIERVEEID